MAARKVLLIELNEITLRVIEPMIKRGKMPNFSRLRAEGTFAAPEAIEKPPHLDPWVTWVTLHTGQPRSAHGATVLEQDSDSIKAKRTWHYAAEAGRTVGVFGSISAFPPKPVPGFIVPGPFAPSDDTYPAYLRPVQALNRRYTKVHAKIAAAQSPLDMARQGIDLFRLGLRPATCARIARQLVAERRKPHLAWKRVSLQPFINMDFFEALYRRYQPDYATWHTNHAAHYMHHYWRSYDDSEFLTRASAEEKAQYGAAVEYGYEVCDEILGRFMRLVDENTVLVVASSMGQQPYVTDKFPKGRIAVRFKDIPAVQTVLDILGARGVTEIVPTMVPQVNVKIPEAGERARVRDLLLAARREGTASPGAIFVTETEDILTLSPAGLAEPADLRYFFPGAPNARAEGYAMGDIFAADAPTPKEGYHHPTGLLLLHGAGIRRGVEISDTTSLDVAPTILALMGIPVPSVMKGRALTEAWQVPAPASVATAKAS